MELVRKPASADNAGEVAKNKIQKKGNSDTYSSTTAGVLTFSNLVIGNLYRITISALRFIRTNTNDTSANINATHDGTALFDTYGVGLASAGSVTETAETLSGISGTTYFTATATTVTVDITTSGSGSVIGPQAILEELNNVEITDEW